MEHELKYSMLPPRLLADNYTSRRYKELGRLKLKAPKISCRGGGEPPACFSGLAKCTIFSKGNSQKRGDGEVKEKERKKEVEV